MISKVGAAPDFHRPVAIGIGDALDLQQRSGEFRSWWSRHDVSDAPDGHKTMAHPRLGPLEFDYVSLQVPASRDQKLVLYTCTPPTAARLSELLAAEPIRS